jgi:hypothetical protein
VLYRALACTAAGLALAACAARVERENVFAEGRTEIELRREVRAGEAVAKGYSHPALIAPTRLANTLASIDIRKGGADNERVPAIPSDTLYTIAKGVSAALEKASPDQELAVISLRNEKRFGIFDRNYLTSFICYVKGDQLYVHLSRVDWELPRDKNARIPWPSLTDEGTPLRIVPGRGISVAGTRTAAIDWRSDFFAKQRAFRVSSSGEIERRTILMESPEVDVAPSEPGEALPADLAPSTLRALADLEEERRQGKITESYYQARRSEILNQGGAP